MKTASANGHDSPRRFPSHPADHRFFTAMAILASLTILAGFASTYGPKVVTGSPQLAPIVHVHAVVFAAWLAVLVAQTGLVLAGRTALHRRLGVAGVGLAALMLVVGAATAVTVARQGHRGIPGVEFPDAAGFLLLNLAAIAVFFVLTAAGWYFRRDAQAHKRLMLMATIGGLVGPGASRLPFASGRPPVIAALILVFLLAGPAYDLATRRRVHPAYAWAVLVALLSIPPLVKHAAATGAWQTIASILMR